MTLPPVMRVFFAVDLPQSIREELVGFISLLKKRSKTNAIRWTKADNLHITLQFMAEVRTEHVPKLVENVRAQMGSVSHQMTLSTGRLHLFPNPYRPRVIVLDVLPQEDLAELAGRIGEGIKVTGYEIESRPFRAHLTVGRIKQPQGLDLGFLGEVALPSLKEIELNEVVLFRSEPQAEGSIYTVLEKLALAEDCLK